MFLLLAAPIVGAHTTVFDSALSFMLKNEGGYVNHSSDPGGETNFGISKRSYPGENIKGMTRARARVIYRRDFWHKPRLERMENKQLALKVFDSGVLVGSYRGVAILQKILGVKVDGVIGKKTNAAINNAGPELIKQYVTALKRYFRAIVKRRPKSRVFLKGWLRRADLLPEIKAKNHTTGETANAH